MKTWVGWGCKVLSEVATDQVRLNSPRSQARASGVLMPHLLPLKRDHLYCVTNICNIARLS